MTGKQQPYTFREKLLFPTGNFNAHKLSESIQNKTILITGASYGIGECTAQLLAQTGVHLILAARSADKLNVLKTQLEQKGARVSVFAADLIQTEQVNTLAAFLQSLPDGLDIVISNAGKSIRRSIFQSLDRPQDINRTIHLNYTGPSLLLLQLIPLLEKNKGQIINVSAINVLLRPYPKWAAYQASKIAFDQWLRSISPELRLRGISTSAVYLPLVRTRMIEPTAAYKNMPAMSPQHAANIIGKCIYTRRKKHTPWWMFMARTGSFLFGHAAAKKMARQI